ncbi:hypothetical protein BYT27DRAFT_6514540 [Phlegmacium glaucopus]|nr:hypothetical protein BYT27DRAFT_6514540 [Phlegmacium glaucopus]
MRLLQVIETRPNPEAICALSHSAHSSYLAYPSPVPSPMSLATAANGSPGFIVYFISTPVWRRPPFLHQYLTVANVIQAHKSPLSFLSINSTGSLLATSSDKGIVMAIVKTEPGSVLLSWIDFFLTFTLCLFVLVFRILFLTQVL